MAQDDEEYTQEELDEAYEQGKADRQRYEDHLQDDPTGLETVIRQLVQDDYYNPPDSPDLREEYDRGFHE